MPSQALASIRANRRRAEGTDRDAGRSGIGSANIALRQELDLFANVRPCRHYPGVPSVYDEVDLVVVRENTEDVYTGVEFEVGTVELKELIAFIDETTGVRIREDSGISVKAISRGGSERIARFAFDEARRRGRKRVTAAHKANIMKFSDGLFLEDGEACRRGVSGHRVRRPDHRRAVHAARPVPGALRRPGAAEPLRGHRLRARRRPDRRARVAPGGHLGDEVAVFEATHGTAPRLAGRDRANPVGLMLSAAMMLRHLGEAEAGDRLEAAIAGVLADGHRRDAGPASRR